MQCQTVQHQLSEYMDGELRSGEKRQIQQHLAGCADCRNTLEEMRKAWNLLDVLPGPKPAPYLRTRILARLGDSKAPARRRWFEHLLLPISATAVALVGIWLGSLVGKNGDAAAENQKTEDPVAVSYADHLDDLPSASLSNAYFTDYVQE